MFRLRCANDGGLMLMLDKYLPRPRSNQLHLWRFVDEAEEERGFWSSLTRAFDLPKLMISKSKWTDSDWEPTTSFIFVLLFLFFVIGLLVHLNHRPWNKRVAFDHATYHDYKSFASYISSTGHQTIQVTVDRSFCPSTSLNKAACGMVIDAKT